jgi:Holliday junction resolvase RusA-like endonuclease
MINITIPVYFTNVYKTKPSKTFLVSLNWYRNAFYHEQNKVKQYFHELIKEQLVGNTTAVPNQYKVSYSYYYKNGASDLANVTPMCSKWVNDVLQELDIVQNDNVKYLVGETHEVAAQDKENPRVEIQITTVK